MNQSLAKNTSTSNKNDHQALNTALVIGASGGIASAIIAELLKDPSLDVLVAISRKAQPAQLTDPRVQWHCCDYSAAAITALAKQLATENSTRVFKQVFICHGILHNSTIKPEKRLEDLNSESLHEVFHINAVLPILWLKALRPTLSNKNVSTQDQQSCYVAVLSARVGSISDNQLGGWYSYRASKSALNMLLKNAAIEYSRRAKNVKIIAFHPGTTDTELSKPFQKNVPAEKLFSSSFVAKQLLKLLEQQDIDGQLSFVDWDHKTIDW